MTHIYCAALLFDMDGVLVDSTPAVARVWSRWALRHNIDPAWSVQKAHGRPSLVTVQELLPNASPEVHRSENEWMEREEIADTEDVMALPGTVELLSSLPSDRFCVVTSATRMLAEVRLSAAGLLQYVRHMVTSTDIARGKPDPEPYAKGAAKLQLRSHDCIVIEDAPSGIRSGKAAGSRVIGIRTTTPDADLLSSGADWIINDCSSLHISAIDSARLALELVDNPNERRIPKMS